MLILSITLSLLIAVLILLFGRMIIAKNILKFYFIPLSFSLYLIIIFINQNCIVVYDIIELLKFNLLIISLSFIINNITYIMMTLVIFITFTVSIYSLSYMEGDPHILRFLSYLSLFSFFMVALITANTLIQLFLGWEGVGICSYLLISFWYQRIEAIKSAMKAIVVNRFGDMAFIMIIIILWSSYNSINIMSINSICCNSICYITIIMMIISATSKSSQFGLHSWLPDAMEGPTPVSALIHAATMVTAGVFFLIKFSFILEIAHEWLIIIMVLGSFTSIFSATIGLVQNDFKKIIAYSTCSQLGYMIAILGLSYYSLSLFHLFNHGFFKALLFLSAGSLIHTLSDEQDGRKSGIVTKSSPITYTCIIVGSLALMGIPFLTGFYSKDVILELTYANIMLTNIYLLTLFAACITAAYSIKLIFWAFFNNATSAALIEKLKHESSSYLMKVLIILCLASLFTGYFYSSYLLLEINPIVNSYYKNLPLIATIISALVTLLCLKNLNGSNLFNNFLNEAWFINEFYNYAFNDKIFDIGKVLFVKMDKQMVELIGPKLGSITIINLIKKINMLQLGSISNYFIMFLTLVILLIIKC